MCIILGRRSPCVGPRFVLFEFFLKRFYYWFCVVRKKMSLMCEEGLRGNDTVELEKRTDWATRRTMEMKEECCPITEKRQEEEKHFGEGEESKIVLEKEGFQGGFLKRWEEAFLREGGRLRERVGVVVGGVEKKKREYEKLWELKMGERVRKGEDFLYDMEGFLSFFFFVILCLGLILTKVQIFQ